MASPSPLILAGARLVGSGGAPVDVFIADGVVTRVEPAGALGFADALTSSDAPAATSARRIDLDGRWLMPGLVDYHAHFGMWAKHRSRLDVSAARSAEQAVAIVAGALAARADAGAGDKAAPLVGRGFQDALWPDLPTAELLDAATEGLGLPGTPVVLISHDLHCVWINSAAAARYPLPAGFTPAAGIIREAQAFEIQKAVEREESANPAAVDALIRDAVRAASARGVTGIRDINMADNPVVWAERVAAGVRELRVSASVYAEHLEAAHGRGDRTGTPVEGTDGLVTVGPLKTFADGALNTRTAWCDDAYPGTSDHGHSVFGPGELAAVLADARAKGFEVALHAIGDRAVREALDAFEASGARGSIEHAQLVADADIGRFAALGVIASVQPEHALDDREVSDALWAGRTHRTFPFAALLRSGATLRLGSDAPVAPLEPWFAISAAVARTRDALAPWEPSNALTVGQALAASTASAGVVPGMDADLAVLDADPLACDAATLRAMPVSLTVTAGLVAFEA